MILVEFFGSVLLWNLCVLFGLRLMLNWFF